MTQIEKALATNCSPYGKLILAALTIEKKRPSLARLAELTGLSKASICRALLELESGRLIKRVRRENEDGGRATNRYELTL